MPQKINVIGIGGTGMRCLESFVHLCAMGMMDDTEVNILALDTDARNGNFTRLKELIADYRLLSPDQPAKDTFFSAKINYYEFSPNYDGADFNKVVNYNAASSDKVDEDANVRKSDLVDLFLTPEQRSMNLEHGYRAQTQMGSLLMYRAIIDEAITARRRPDRKSGLIDFLTKSGLGSEPGQKVFIFGSVFGGTGASSIPVLPDALNKAIKIYKRTSAIDILKGNYFGTVVLTNYFSFPKPEGVVVADSDFFSLNSQAALMFYEKDASVKKVYNRLYLIGRESPTPLPAKVPSKTGGSDQRNPADFIELVAAMAAYDFFKTVNEDTEKGEFYYLGYNAGLKHLDFVDFTSTDASSFKKHFGAAIATALTNARGQFFNYLVDKHYTDVKQETELKALNSYFNRLLNPYIDSETGDYTQGGWAQQLADSAKSVFGADTAFLLHNEVFDSAVPVKKKKYNERLFADKVGAPTFSAGGFFGDGLYDKVRNTIQSEQEHATEKHTTLLQLIRDTYDTFVKLYNL